MKISFQVQCGFYCRAMVMVLTMIMICKPAAATYPRLRSWGPFRQRSIGPSTILGKWGVWVRISNPGKSSVTRVADLASHFLCVVDYGWRIVGQFKRCWWLDKVNTGKAFRFIHSLIKFCDTNLHFGYTVSHQHLLHSVHVEAPEWLSGCWLWLSMDKRAFQLGS